MHYLLYPRYYQLEMQADISQYIRNYHLCRRAYVPRDKTLGYLHLLPIPDRLQRHITIDFKSMPKDKFGYDCVLVIIDHLSKQAISILCYKTVTAEQLAELFITYVYCYYKALNSIVLDCSPQFILAFQNAFCKILEIKLKLSIAYYLQTDRQTKIMNQYLDQRLCPFVNYYQNNQSQLLPMMDYAQLILPYSSLGMMSLYELLNGYTLHTSFDQTPLENLLTTVSEQLSYDKAREVASRIEQALEKGKEYIQRAQDKKEQDVNAYRQLVDFGKDDEVQVLTKNQKIQQPSRKLDDQIASPFKVVEQVGNSYQLQLPKSMKIHDVFSSDRLCKNANDPLLEQANEKPSPIQVAADDEQEVREILVVKQLYRKLLY